MNAVIIFLNKFLLFIYIFFTSLLLHSCVSLCSDSGGGRKSSYRTHPPSGLLPSGCRSEPGCGSPQSVAARASRLDPSGAPGLDGLPPGPGELCREQSKHRVPLLCCQKRRFDFLSFLLCVSAGGNRGWTEPVKDILHAGQVRHNSISIYKCSMRDSLPTRGAPRKNVKNDNDLKTSARQAA